jgi:hypothetical protein
MQEVLILVGVLDVTFLEEIITDIERREPLLIFEGSLVKHLCLPSLLYHARFMHARGLKKSILLGAQRFHQVEILAMPTLSLNLNVRILFLLLRNGLFAENRNNLVFLDDLLNDSTA